MNLLGKRIKKTGVKKYSSITRKIVVNVALFAGALLIVFDAMFAIAIQNYYYNAVSDYISSVALSFDELAVVPSASYGTQARLLAEEFPLKSKIEVQFINSDGDIVVSTNGYLPDSSDTYGGKMKSDSAVTTWEGELSTGERVMSAQTELGRYDGKPSNGSVRCVTSLAAVDKQIVMLTAVVSAVELVVLGILVLMGKYYAQSIVKPIREVGAVAHRIADGNFKSRIKVRELNEIGELCDTINYMAGELQSTENMKNEFISSVSHELRTPLTAIKGWGETVKDSLGTDEELVSKGIGVILHETDRLSGLVEELLDFSRIQSGRMTYNMTKLDILAELGEAVCVYEETARKANVKIIYNEPQSAPFVIGDASRLVQVFVNIIDNAIKYNHPGGTVTIDAGSSKGFVNITVTDTGVGIPADDVDKVKEKFYKANKTVRGSGIGLAVADEIIRHHNGMLFIESKENVGTKVTVSIPIAEQIDFSLFESHPKKGDGADE